MGRVTLAPFEPLTINGESITLDISANVIILPTGHPYLLSGNNEFTLSAPRSLKIGKSTFLEMYGDNNIQEMRYPWIAVYNSSDKKLNFFIFSERPKKLEYIVTNNELYGAYLTSTGDYYLTSDGDYYCWYDAVPTITKLILYPGNGSIFQGVLTYPTLTRNLNSTSIPDVLHHCIEGSITKFLKPYSANIGYDQYITSYGEEYQTPDGTYYFTSNSIPQASILVNESNIICDVPDGFASFSLETFTLCNFIQKEAIYPRIEQEFRNIGPAILRVGGGGANFTLWDPDGVSVCDDKTRYGVFNETIIDNLFTFVKKIGWKVIWNTNMAANDPATYADEVNYIYSNYAADLIGIEICNEPENLIDWGLRPNTYTPAQFITEWESYKNAIFAINPNIPLIGPSSGSTSYLQTFASNENQYVSMISQHYYPLSASGIGTMAPTIENLLSPLCMNTAINLVKGWKNISVAAGLPLILGETNSVFGGGKFGTSDTTAATLWAIDYMFNMMKLGCSGVYFHGVVAGGSYAPIYGVDGTPRAMYYGMLLFHHAANDGVCVDTLTSSPSANIVSHAVVGDDGKLRVVVINKDLYNDVAIEISTSNEYSHVSMIEFSSIYMSAAAGFKLGGSSVGDDGSWNPIELDLEMISSKKVTVTVKVCNAIVITLS
jgi:hypothetical protein